MKKLKLTRTFTAANTPMQAILIPRFSLHRNLEYSMPNKMPIEILFFLILTIFITTSLASCDSSTESTESVGPIEIVYEDPLAVYEGDEPFVFMDSSDPNVPVWSSSNDGYIPNENDTRSEVVIDETFTVAANTEFEFSDKIIWVRPTNRANIEIFGTLRLTNSLIIWEQTEHQQTRLIINEGGRLYAKNTYVFSGNKFWLNWGYNSGATIRLDHFVGNPWTALEGIVDYEAINYSTVKMTIFGETTTSTVIIKQAHHIWLELFPPENSTVNITLPKKRTWVDWTVDSMWPNTTINITESYLYERDVSLTNGTKLTVRNTPSGFSMGWTLYQNDLPYIDCEMRDLGDPNDNEGVHYENKTWALPCNGSSLTIINSKLQRIWPTFWGKVNLSVYNSNLVDTRVFGAGATYKIFDSTIDIIEATRGSQVYIENSKVTYDIDVKDSETKVYGYKVTPREETDFSVLESDGGQYIIQSTPGSPF